MPQPTASKKTRAWRTFPNLSWKYCFWRAVFTVYLHCLFKLFTPPVTTTCLLCMTDLFQRKILSQLVHRCFVVATNLDASLLRMCSDPHRQPTLFQWALAFRNTFRHFEPPSAFYRQETSSPAKSLDIHHPSSSVSTAGPRSLHCNGARGNERIAVSGVSNTQQNAALSWAPFSHPVHRVAEYLSVPWLQFLGWELFHEGTEVQDEVQEWCSPLPHLRSTPPAKSVKLMSSRAEKSPTVLGTGSGWVPTGGDLTCCVSPTALADAITTALFTWTIRRKQ